MGRRQLLLVSDARAVEVGIEAFAQIKLHEPPATDAAVVAYIDCVLQPLLQSAGQDIDAASWETAVFARPIPNAFALPGAKLGIYQGIFMVAETDAQLASVLGHEMAHVIAGHGRERLSTAPLSRVCETVLSAFMLLRHTHVYPFTQLPSGKMEVVPFGREQESEADIMGMWIMAQAGFDPRESLTLWRNMQSFGGPSSGGLLSTHPAISSRMQNIRAYLPEAVALFEQAAGHRPACVRPLGVGLP